MAPPSEARLDALLNHRGTAALLVAFFDPTAAFEGDLMYTIPDNDPHAITVGDLFAVTMLDVAVAPLGVRRLLLQQQTRDQVAGLLRLIPTEVDIWNGGDCIRPGAPADRLLRLLQRQGDRIGPTTAGKILARKRPRLIPIVDSVVEEVLGGPARDHWAFLGRYLAAPDRRARLAEVRPPAVAQTVPLLRMLDIVIWMWGSGAGVTRKVRARAGLPLGGWKDLPGLLG